MLAKMKKIHNTINLTTIVCIITACLSGCTLIRPPAHIIEEIQQSSSTTFDYSGYSQVLMGHVGNDGLVDYIRLARDSTELDTFYAQVAAFSPDSHPHYFPQSTDRLAYWLNAYNSTVMRGIVEHYPITSVEAVKPPLLLFFFPDKSGFFFFQRFTYGGTEIDLYALENKIIRKRFDDPRIHFALNCASLSCPKLPKEPFYPDRLDIQLDREAKKFINDTGNVWFDEEHNTLHLSSIFKWYEEDFTSWLATYYPSKKPTLAAYVALYLQPESAMLLEKRPETLSIEFLPYDWGLNDAAHH